MRTGCPQLLTSLALADIRELTIPLKNAGYTRLTLWEWPSY
jgi:hypothetical protein